MIAKYKTGLPSERQACFD